MAEALQEPRPRARRTSAIGPFAEVIDRGWYKLMQYINALIGCLFVVMALISAFHPDPLLWLPYSIAAILSLLTIIVADMESPALHRVLAVMTASLMFFFFAGFFANVPTTADWYKETAGWTAVFRLLAAFAMIPILSSYSCLAKKECREARLAERRAFFSVPDHIPPHS